MACLEEPCQPANSGLVASRDSQQAESGAPHLGNVSLFEIGDLMLLGMEGTTCSPAAAEAATATVAPATEAAVAEPAEAERSRGRVHECSMDSPIGFGLGRGTSKASLELSKSYATEAGRPLYVKSRSRKRSSCEDIDMRSLESKLELLSLQRRLSLARSEAFLAELEAYNVQRAAASLPHRRKSMDSSTTNSLAIFGIPGSGRFSEGMCLTHFPLGKHSRSSDRTRRESYSYTLTSPGLSAQARGSGRRSLDASQRAHRRPSYTRSSPFELRGAPAVHHSSPLPLCNAPTSPEPDSAQSVPRFLSSSSA